MARKKNIIVFLSRNDILELAKNKYKNVRYSLENDPDRSARDAYNKYINKTLKEHHLIPEGENTSSDEKVISKDIATFIVNELLNDYFSKDPKSRKQKREEWRKKKIEKIKEKSREQDRILNEIQRQSHIAYSHIASMEYSGEYVNEEEVLENFPLLSKDNPDTNIDDLVYHLPLTSDFEVNESFQFGYSTFENTINQIVDRLMLRAIFDIFYEFDEITYCRDFLERLKLINTDVVPFEVREGYSELTTMLENPLEHYVFHKKSPKEKTPKNSDHALDTDSQDRLKQYADKHGISVSDAIRNLIQDPPLKRENK